MEVVAARKLPDIGLYNMNFELIVTICIEALPDDIITEFFIIADDDPVLHMLCAATDGAFQNAVLGAQL